MKMFSKVLVFVLAFVTFATLESKAQEWTKEKVQLELENGVVSFVNAVRPVYVKGMSLEKFKLALVGKSNSVNITKEGSDLLNKAFTLISNGSSEGVIKKEGFKEFATATKYVLDYHKSNSVELTSDKGSVSLFGGNADELNQTLTSGKTACKWYQLGCHLKNLWAWLVINIDTLGGIVTILCQFINCK